ncbi:MAG TPA: arginase family protein [Acidimicrobiales bacterium]|nr:arginase family protein [Acidimicrobiales bacterium]
MPAVDSPAPGGLTIEELEIVVGRLLSNPNAVGIDICVFDPDLDLTGGYARKLAVALNAVLCGL